MTTNAFDAVTRGDLVRSGTGGGAEFPLDLAPTEKPLDYTLRGALDPEHAKRGTAAEKDRKTIIRSLLRQISEVIRQAQAELAENSHLRAEHFLDAGRLWAECHTKRAVLKKVPRAFLELLLPYLTSDTLLTNDEPCKELRLVVLEFADNLDADEKDIGIWKERLLQTGLDASWPIKALPSCQEGLTALMEKLSEFGLDDSEPFPRPPLLKND